MELLFVLIKSIVIFLAVPLMMGQIIVYRQRITYRYAVGFLTMLSGFYVIYLVTYYTHHSVHVMHFLFIAFICAAALVWLIFYSRRIHPIDAVRKVAAAITAHPAWIIFGIIVALQIYRTIAYTQINYSDDDTYIPMVADMIATDKFYMIYGPDGSFVSSAYEIPKKYTLSGWMAFEAELSMFTGTHPLILVKTIFPVCEIILHYCIFYELAKVFLKKRDDNAFFMIAYAALLEVGWTATTTTLSYYFLTWLWYGKAFVEFIIIPFLLIAWIIQTDENSLRSRHHKFGYFAILLITSMAGAAASMMGVVLIVTEVAFLSLSSVIIQRRLKPIVTGMITLLPQAAVAALYLLS